MKATCFKSFPVVVDDVFLGNMVQVPSFGPGEGAHQQQEGGFGESCHRDVMGGVARISTGESKY